MNTEHLKELILSETPTLPILDKSGTPVGFADTKAFMTEGLRMAARISLANGKATPIREHVQTLLTRRGGDDYAKAYIRAVWALQDGFFDKTLEALMARGGDIRQGFVDGFDNDTTAPEPCS
ncbi:hypothetical protein [Arthrobacter sp. StoSoilB22]|uniref:hypothetical protein n=1 Tax=Arthrobacter sp. StoSoilB22 TaxID=2830996 RepID=UPI001CC575EA|nr:hypothetical protein [Arthrobacter sp. StoSoilB22]BCW62467.1 hypothetical protein StoSoilB22_14400 [Arthrobacter sp. StoSoilB22]